MLIFLLGQFSYTKHNPNEWKDPLSTVLISLTFGALINQEPSIASGNLSDIGTAFQPLPQVSLV